MPTNRAYDFLLGGKGFMLARPGKGLARAWQRTGIPDTPTIEQPRIASEFGGAPPQIEVSEVWNDWSGGFGYAYRHPQDENSYYGFLANPTTYHWAENFDARFGRQLVHAQKLVKFESSLGFNGVESIIDAPPAGSIPFAGAGAIVISSHDIGVNHLPRVGVYAPTGTGNIPWTVLTSFTSAGDSQKWTHRPAVFGSFIYAGNQDPGQGFVALAYDISGSTSVVIADVPAMRLVVAGNRLWRAHGPSNGQAIWLQSIANTALSSVLTAANWSATINVGDAARPILDMVAMDDQVYLGKPDGLFAGDMSGTFVNVLPEIAGQTHPDNGRDLAIYNHQVIYPHIGGLYAFANDQTGRATQIGPQGHSNTSPVRGYVRCIANYGQWLYGGLFNGSTSYVLAGYDQDGQNHFVWHTLQKMPSQFGGRVHRLHFDGITSSSTGLQLPNRFYVAEDDSLVGADKSLYYHGVPFGNNNPLLSGFGFSANYTNSARMDMGNTDGRAPTTPKLYRSCEVWADNLDGSQRWGLLYYTIDQGARTLLGTVNTSPRSVLFFPNAESSFAMGQSIELSLESYIAAGAEATTPVYRSLILRQMQVPRSIDTITAVVDVGDNTMDRQGTRMRPGANQLAELRGWVATGPVQLVDLTGASSWAKVLAPVEEQESFQDDVANPSVFATIKLAILSFSGN